MTNSIFYFFQVGDTIGFTHFVSTSMLVDVGCYFLKQQGTLLEICDCIGDVKRDGRLGVRSYSQYPMEEEVLIWPYFAYKVVEIIPANTISANSFQTIRLQCLPLPEIHQKSSKSCSPV